MTQWVNQIKEALPEYARDTKLNIDAVIKRSTLAAEEVEYIALAAAFATGNSKLWLWIEGQLDNTTEKTAALTAASLMAMNNTWYPYVEMAGDPQLSGLPAQLRMNAIATHGGTTKGRFESYSLAASIVGRCHFCVKAHYDTLRHEGYSVEQLRDIGRVAAVIQSVARVLTA